MIKPKYWAHDALQHMRPPNMTSVSDWAKEYRYLDKSHTRFPGRWQHDRTPYLVEPMNAMTDHGVREITLCFSAQVGKSESAMNLIGRTIHLDPAPIVLVHPTIKTAEQWGRGRLRDLVRSSPSLREICGDSRGGKTLTYMKFGGGALYVVGANSPTGLASTSAKVLILEEIDRYPERVGDSGNIEGDPVDLARRRVQSYSDESLVLAVSTPTTQLGSRIWSLLEQGTFEIFDLACHKCGHYHPLRFDAMKQDDKNGVHFTCPKCEAIIQEKHRYAMLQTGRWRSTNPDARQGHRSFHLWAAYSPSVTWDDLWDQYKTAQGDDNKMRVFINTGLGLPYVDEQEQTMDLDTDALPRNNKDYLPDHTLFLTAGVDIQGDRLEISVLAIGGQGSQSLTVDVVEHKQFQGSPINNKVWGELSAYVRRKSWAYKGRTRSLKIKAVAVDFGYQAKYGEWFVREHHGINGLCAWGVRSSAGPQARIIGGQIGVSNKTRTSKRTKIPVKPPGVDAYWIGGSEIKDEVYALIDSGRVGFSETLPDAYMNQLFSEIRVPFKSMGVTSYRWVNRHNRRNEALDCMVYGFAGAHLLNYSPQAWQQMYNRRRQELGLDGKDQDIDIERINRDSTQVPDEVEPVQVQDSGKSKMPEFERPMIRRRKVRRRLTRAERYDKIRNAHRRHK